MLDFNEPGLVAEFHLLHLRSDGGVAGDEAPEGGVGKPGDVVESGQGHGLKVDFRAHSTIKNEGGFSDVEAPFEELEQTCQGFVIGAVAPQDTEADRNAVFIGDDGEIDLHTVGAVIAAVAVVGEAFGAMAFEVDACDVVESDADFVRKSFLIESGHERRPASGELIHRGVEIVLIKFF